MKHHTVEVVGVTVKYCVERLSTEIQFPSGAVKTFPNWDVKGVREAFYVENYVTASDEELLLTTPKNGDAEFGIGSGDVARFIRDKEAKFEDFLIPAPTADQPRKIGVLLA